MKSYRSLDDFKLAQFTFWTEGILQRIIMAKPEAKWLMLVKSHNYHCVPKEKKRGTFFSQWAAKILRWQPYNGNPGQQADQNGYCFNNAAATIHKRFWCLHAVCHFPENNELAFEKNTLF